MKSLLGDEFDAFQTAMQQTESPASIRLNRGKTAGICMDAEAVPWCEGGYYLRERASYTFDPAFHAGAYYVQEASSMFLAHVVASLVQEPVRCLDLCAAPGGKATLLCDMLPDGSLLVCNEAIRSRCTVLVENIIKWGSPSTFVCNNDPSELGRLVDFFDVIVADLPCSGEGMFRKDPQSAKEWSTEHIKFCASRQRRIICDVWNALRPGGILIYSTCTYNVEENENNIRYISENLHAEPLNIRIPAEWGIAGGITVDTPSCRFFPHKVKGEGFFLAALRKSGNVDAASFVRKDKCRGKTVYQQAAWLRCSERFRLETEGKFLKAYTLKHYNDCMYLADKLRMVYAGILLGEQKGRDFVPAHALAMSVMLDVERFPVIDVDWETAISYLRKDVILPVGAAKCYALLMYKGLVLGFVKQLGERSNNLYPSEWRIRSQKKVESQQIFPLLTVR